MLFVNISYGNVAKKVINSLFFHFFFYCWFCQHQTQEVASKTMWTIDTTVACAAETICAKPTCCDTFGTNASESRPNSIVTIARPNIAEKKIWFGTPAPNTKPPFNWIRNRRICAPHRRMWCCRQRRWHRRRLWPPQLRPNFVVTIVRRDIGGRTI